MKRYTSIILMVIVLLFTIVPIAIGFWVSGMFDLVNQVLGPIFWIGVITFLVLILTIIFFAMKYARKWIKPKTLTNGLPATATIIRSYQGNMKVTFGGVQENFKMIIEVDVKNNSGETWQAKMEEMIPIQQISIFQPGVSFKVLYDPNDRSKVVFDQSQQPQQNTASVNIPGYGEINSQTAQAAKQTAPQDITLRLQAANALLQELETTGVPATATVLSNQIIYPNYMNGADVYQLKLRVNALGMSPFEAEVIALTAKTAIHKIEPGKSVFVKYNYNNPQRIVMTGTDKADNIIKL